MSETDTKTETVSISQEEYKKLIRLYEAKLAYNKRYIKKNPQKKKTYNQSYYQRNKARLIEKAKIVSKNKYNQMMEAVKNVDTKKPESI